MFMISYVGYERQHNLPHSSKFSSGLHRGWAAHPASTFVWSRKQAGHV